MEKVKVTHETGLDTDYYGYNEVCHVEYSFEKQKAKLDIEIWPDSTNELRIESLTDGYHWLQYFLSQKPNATELQELSFNEQIIRCEQIFLPYGMGYRQECKETAYITYPPDTTRQEAIDIVIKEVGIRFANRERFFE